MEITILKVEAKFRLLNVFKSGRLVDLHPRVLEKLVHEVQYHGFLINPSNRGNLYDWNIINIEPVFKEGRGKVKGVIQVVCKEQILKDIYVQDLTINRRMRQDMTHFITD